MFCLRWTDFHQRKAEILPLVEAAEQRPHATNADLSELQRHTGAGGFVRSSTEEDDLAIPRDFAAPGGEIFGRDLQRSG